MNKLGRPLKERILAFRPFRSYKNCFERIERKKFCEPKISSGTESVTLSEEFLLQQKISLKIIELYFLG